MNLKEIFKKTGVLKKIPRMGWLMRGIKPCESVADHCFRVVFIAMTLNDKFKLKLDTAKLLKIATLHEICETVIGDLALEPAQTIGFDVKSAAELKAMKKIFGDDEDLKHYIDVWLEFENTTSPEGRVVKIADKLDMLLQAEEYEEAGWKNLKDFWKNDSNFKGYEFEEIENFLKELRKDYYGRNPENA